MKRITSWVAAATLLSALVLVAGPGCSNQGEGERCDTNNGNDDCASGLTCQKIEGQKSALCCPPPPNAASVAECIPGTSLIPDSGPPSDSGQQDAVEDVAPDAVEDASEMDAMDAAPDADAAQDATTSDVAEDAVSDAAEETD